MKIEVFILGGQRIDRKRMKAWCSLAFPTLYLPFMGGVAGEGKGLGTLAQTTCSAVDK